MSLMFWSVPVLLLGCVISSRAVSDNRCEPAGSWKPGQVLDFPRSMELGAKIKLIYNYHLKKVQDCIDICCSMGANECSIAEIRMTSEDALCKLYECSPQHKCQFTSSKEILSYERFHTEAPADLTTPKQEPSTTTTSIPSTVATTIGTTVNTHFSSTARITTAVPTTTTAEASTTSTTVQPTVTKSTSTSVVTTTGTSLPTTASHFPSSTTVLPKVTTSTVAPPATFSSSSTSQPTTSTSTHVTTTSDSPAASIIVKNKSNSSEQSNLQHHTSTTINSSTAGNLTDDHTGNLTHYQAKNFIPTKNFSPKKVNPLWKENMLAEESLSVNETSHNHKFSTSSIKPRKGVGLPDDERTTTINYDGDVRSSSLPVILSEGGRIISHVSYHLNPKPVTKSNINSESIISTPSAATSTTQKHTILMTTSPRPNSTITSSTTSSTRIPIGINQQRTSSAQSSSSTTSTPSPTYPKGDIENVDTSFNNNSTTTNNNSDASSSSKLSDNGNSLPEAKNGNASGKATDDSDHKNASHPGVEDGSNYRRTMHIYSETSLRVDFVPRNSSTSLIVGLSLGLLVVFIVIGLISRRIFDLWQRRHYSRMDFLVDGMYH